ncbi:MAG: primosomal protein N' [Bacillota bacterium]|nr:primosomal protein N' [Bacillota bacterium]
MQVDVVLLKTVNQTDRLYSYNVRDSIVPMIHVGSRVLVPFGKGNKVQEAVVFRVNDEYNPKYKSVHSLFDEDYDLNYEIVELVKELKEYYLSNYSWFLRSAIPTGAQLSIETEYIYESEEIKQSIDDNKVSIGTLIDEGKVIQKVRYKKKNNEKSTKFIKLMIDEIELESLISKIRSNAINQKRILNQFLKSSEKIIDSKNIDVPSATINSLVDKGIFEIEYRKAYRENIHRLEHKKNGMRHDLTEEQQNAFDSIKKSIDNNEHQLFLLHGVTGSGKTEIYMHLAEEVLKKGESVLILVPEISLVPLMAQRFIERFGQLVAFYHSKMSSSEKMDEWLRIKYGDLKIIIGARSAVFTPAEKIGLIVIDEEHSGSYKSDTQPNYNAKHVAVLRGEYHKAPIVFGSATPSVETYYNSFTESMQYIYLSKRANNQDMPKGYLVDMREELKSGNKSIFSRLLELKIQERIDKNEQVILFINKKGYSSFISCRECGHVMKCPHCDIPLIYHKKGHYGECKVCGYKTSIPKLCPTCSSKYFKYFGIGTEKIEEMIIKKFNNCKVIRMDSLSMSRKNALNEAYEDIRNNVYNVILGTQIVAKGHDFENVTLVGILAADINLNVPNYNSSEVTYQLLTQAMGRSGRGESKGEVVIQTYSPDHYAILSALQHDYKMYIDYELSIRKEMKYPPFYKLINIIISSTSDTEANKYSYGIAKELKRSLDSSNVNIIGPGPAILEKAKNLYRYQIVIKLLEVDQSYIKGIISNISKKIKKQSVFISVDVDPVSLI